MQTLLKLTLIKNLTIYLPQSVRSQQIFYRGHGDDCPPVRVKHRVEARGLLLLLKHKDERGEHDGTHPQQQEQQAQLLVVCLHCVTKGLESSRVFSCRIMFRIYSISNLKA